MLTQKVCLLRPSKPVHTVNSKSVKRVLALLDFGLPAGLGVAKPGQMCVEAAVSYAMGYDHSDRPSCVAQSISSLKISINDMRWSTNKARGRGMKRVAIAQLGSKSVKWVKSYLNGSQKIETEISDDQLRIAITNQAVLRLITVIAAAIKAKAKPKQIAQLRHELSWFMSFTVGHSNIGILRRLAKNDRAAAAFGYTGPDAANRFYCDVCVDALVELKTKGSKFLYLSRPQARRQKAK